MSDPTPPPIESPELDALRAAHDMLAARLAAGRRLDVVDGDEREALKREITALFRQVDRRLAQLARLKEDVKALVGDWKLLPVATHDEPDAPSADDGVSSPPDASGARPLPAFLDGDDPVPDVPVSAMQARAPVAEHASVRVDHLGASTFVSKGWSLISAGDFGRAEEALRRALELAPDDPEGGALLGWALMGQERFDEALDVCERVLARAPGYPLAKVNVGYVHLRQGRYGQAIEHLAVAAREEGDRKSALYALHYLGLVYLRREMYDDAVAFFRRALALGPNLVEAYYEMGRAHWLAGERDAAREAWRTGAASGKFNAWGVRCAELLEGVDRGEEPPPVM